MAYDKTNKIKIACWGLAGKNAGSLVSANFFLLEELLKRGYEIDFYGIKSFVYPEELLGFKKFCYIDISMRAIEDRLNPLSLFLKKYFGYIFFFGLLQLNYRIYIWRLRRLVKRNNPARRYDLLIFLGVTECFKIKGLPTISWLQGPPQTEWLAIKKLKKTVISLCGPWKYYKLKAYYIYKKGLDKMYLRRSDVLICGSRWAKEMFVSRGFNNQSVKILPYAVELGWFRPLPGMDKDRRAKKVFLWLGRIVPRKRLDLLLEAFSLLLEERKDVHLKIIGNFSYAPEYKKLLDNSNLTGYMDCEEYIGRDKVPELMNSVDILVQPSENENFGSSVAEALSCGLPVIVGPTNGTKDYIGSSSFVFQQYTAQSLRDSMLSALDALEKNRELLIRESRMSAERYFDVSGITDGLENIFREARQTYVK